MDNVGASYGVGQNTRGEDVCLYLPPFVIAANEDKQDLGHMVAQLLGKLLSKPWNQELPVGKPRRKPF